MTTAPHLSALPVPPAHGLDSGEWERRPIPLTDPTPYVEFPSESFPPWLANFVNAAAEATQTPVDLPGVMALGALAAVAGGRVTVQARPDWREPTNLFVALALGPGNRKSAVVDLITRPLRDAEKEQVEKVSRDVKEAQTERDVAEAKAKELTQRASKAAANGDDDAPEKLRNAIAAGEMAELIVVPAMPQFLVDDATPEALATVLYEQHGRVAMIQAEGGVFDIIAGKYSKGVGSFDLYLKGHSGEEIRVNRVGRTPEIIPNPALTMALAVQPIVFKKIAEMDGFRGKGLIPRFLLSMPKSYVGSRNSNPTPILDTVRETYDRELKRLFQSLLDWSDPAVLTFSSEASDALLDYMTELEPHLGPTGSLHHLADWGSKLTGAVVRIAGLLHLASNLRTGITEPIDVDTFYAAARIGDYFRRHALAAFDFMGSDPVIEDARALLAWVSERDTFTKRGAHNGLQHRFERSADLDAPLAILEERGWIRPGKVPPPNPSGGRPPSPPYEVNPKARMATR